MIVQSGAVDNPLASNRSNAVQNQSLDTRANAKSAGSADPDLVQLSNASSLVALAKGKIPADKQATFDTVNAQFSLGQYKADLAGVSRAILQGHIQG